MKKQICFILCIIGIMCSNNIYSQNTEQLWKDSLIKAMLNVGDLVKIDQKSYMLNRSFLSDIAGYKDLFPVPNDLLVCHMMEKGVDTSMNYYPIWLIEKNNLYLIGIGIESSKSNTINVLERSRLIAQLTGGKFSLDDISRRRLDEMTYVGDRLIGAMQASWVTGVYYINPIFKLGDDINGWEKEPILKLTIKNGKIIKTEAI